MIDNNNNNGDDDEVGDISDDNIYRGRAESVLVSLSDSYSEEKILVCDSRSSFCPAYMSYFYYCPKEFYVILS